MQALGIKSIKKLGVQKTLDFKVNHPLHNFIAEGIVISNSHSVSYASLSALTVYLKYKYPLEFYCALLNQTKEETKPLEEVGKIQEELKIFGIELLPPSLIKSQIDFSIEGRNIRYGLGNIKGVSEKTIAGILDFRAANSNKYEMFQFAKQCGLNIGVLSALIHCGALADLQPEKHSRARLALEAQLWNLLTDREKKLCFERGEEHGYDVLTTVMFLKNTDNGKGEKYIKPSRFETIQKKYLPLKEIYEKNSKYSRLCNFFYERSLIGYSYSTNLFEIFKDQAGVKDLVKIQDCLDAEDGQYLEFVGVVTESKTWTSKKGNKCMKMQITDGQATMECMITNSAQEDRLNKIKMYNQNRLPEEDDICHVLAQKYNRGIFINKLGIQNIRIHTKYAKMKKYEKELEKIAGQ